MQNTYIPSETVATYNANFIDKDEKGLNATNVGWCHRYAPFRAFICCPNVIRFLKWFKQNRCQYGCINFDNNFLQRYFGNDYWQDEWCQACCKFIEVLVKNTDKNGILMSNPGYGWLRRQGDPLGDQKVYSNNIEVFECIGNLLRFKYFSDREEMMSMLNAVLSVLVSYPVEFKEKKTMFSNENGFYSGNFYKATRCPIMYVGNVHFSNAAFLGNNRYKILGHGKNNEVYNTHKGLMEGYVRDFKGTNPFISDVDVVILDVNKTCDYSYAVPTQDGNQHQHTVLSEKVKLSKLPEDTNRYNTSINEIRNNLQQMIISNNNFNLAKMWNNQYAMQQAINNYNSNASCYQSNLQLIKDIVKQNHYLTNLAYHDFWIYSNGTWILK